MSGPRVSVIVPTKDRGGSLLRLLEALRGQSLPVEDFEVIVVDDGSTDGTPGVLAALEHDPRLRLRLLRHETSRGPATARNDGRSSPAAHRRSSK